MTFRNKINDVAKKHLKDDDVTMFAVQAYKEFVKAHGDVLKPKDDKNGDFFGADQKFSLFLDLDCEDDIILKAHARLAEIACENENAKSMIARGEELIREAYKITDANSIIAHYDYVADRPRAHMVSLVGIHDGKQLPVGKLSAIIDEEDKCDICKNAIWHDGIVSDCKKEPICDPGVPKDHKCCNGKFEKIGTVKKVYKKSEEK